MDNWKKNRSKNLENAKLEIYRKLGIVVVTAILLISALPGSIGLNLYTNIVPNDDKLGAMTTLDLKFDTPAKSKVRELLNEFQLGCDIEEHILERDTFGSRVSQIIVFDSTAPKTYYVAETDTGKTFELSTEFNEYLAANMRRISSEDDAIQAAELFVRYGFPTHFNNPVFLKNAVDIPNGDGAGVADYGMADKHYVIIAPQAVPTANGYRVEFCTWHEVGGAVVRWTVTIENNEVTYYNWYVLDTRRGAYVGQDEEGFVAGVGLSSGGNLKFGDDLRKWSGGENTTKGARAPAVALSQDHTNIRHNHSSGAVSADNVMITFTTFNPNTNVNITIEVWGYPFAAGVYRVIDLGIHQADATGKLEYLYKPLDHTIYSGIALVYGRNSSNPADFARSTNFDIKDIYEGVIEGKKYQIYYRDTCFGFDRAKALTFATELLNSTFTAYNIQEKTWGFRSKDPDERKIFVNDGVNHDSGVYDGVFTDDSNSCSWGNDVSINIRSNSYTQDVTEGIIYNSQQDRLNAGFSHEMLHNYQFALDGWKGGAAWKWLREGTARLIPGIMFPNAEYQRNSIFFTSNWGDTGSAQAYVDHPDQPLDERSYGCAPLWGYIYGKDGGISTLKDILEERKNQGDALPSDGEKVVDNVLFITAILGSGPHSEFQEVYKDFIVDLYKKNLQWDGKTWSTYLNAAKTTDNNYPGGYMEITKDGGAGELPGITQSADVYSYGIDYQKITLTKTIEKFSITVKWTDDKDKGHIAAIVDGGAAQYLDWDATDKEYGPLTIDPAYNKREVVLAITNYDTSTDRRDYKIILTSPMIESVDDTGKKLDEFWAGDKIYAKGSGFPANREVNLYVTNDQVWIDGTTLAGKNVEDDAVETVTTNAKGEIPVTLVWQTKTEDRNDDIPDDVGSYDIVADVKPSARSASLGTYDRDTDTADGIIDTGFEVTDPKLIVLIFGVVEGGEYETATVTYTALSAIDGIPRIDANYPSPTTFSTEGKYTVRVTATDSKGNTMTKMVNFTIKKKDDGAGGDNPDDSFDIANEFVLTRDILGAYVRLAKKKNLTGVLWYNEFIEKSEAFKINATLLDNESRRAAWYDIQMLSRKILNNEQKILADFSATPDVAVLNTGFASTARAFLTTFNEPSRLVPVDFAPSIAISNPILFIPSGGLYGLENSQLFKIRLQQYLELGGTIIVMAQQHGYEFSALPGNLAGFGWREDQSCLYAATYMDTYTPILSSQSNAAQNINFDGFFTELPQNTTVLMRRTKNSMPAVVCYNYGNGTVIASNEYDDWAYGRSAATTDGKNLVRESINWARFHTPIIEYGTSNEIGINSTVTNGGMSTATAVRFLFMSPSHELTYTVQKSISLTAGSSTVVVANHSAISTLGIWGIDYELIDVNGNVIYTVYDAARFSVSKYTENPGGFTYQGTKIAFTITTPDESATIGSDVAFTVHIWNYNNRTYNVRCKLHFIRQSDPPEKLIIVEPYGEATYAYTLENVNARIDMWAYFYDNDTGESLGSAPKVVKVFSPSVDIEIIPEKTLYGSNETVKFQVNTKNKLSASFDATTKVKVTNPSNYQIYYYDYDVNLSAYETDSYMHNFSLGPSPKQGAYTISVSTYNGYDKIGFSSSNFQVPSVLVALEYELPDTIVANTSIPLNITVRNIGIIPAANCTLSINFAEPDGSILWSNITDFNISAPSERAEQETKQFIVPVGALQLGNYKFSYNITYDSKKISGLIILPASIDIKTEYNRESYRAYDLFMLNVTVENTGRFEMDAKLTTNITMFALSFNETAILTTSGANKTKKFSYSHTVPANISWGSHASIVHAQVGGMVNHTSYFFIEPSELTYTGDITRLNGSLPYISGHVLRIPIKNIGGVDTVCNLTLELYDSYAFKVAELVENFTVFVSTTVERNFTIPNALVANTYFLLIKYIDESTTLGDTVWEEIVIDGYSGTLTTTTNKTLYAKNETVNSTTHIENLDGTLNDTVLNLCVYSTNVLHSAENMTAIIEDPVTNTTISYGSKINNTYLVIAAGQGSCIDGRYTIGTNRGDLNNPNDNDKKLIYGFPSPGSTSFTTIRVDGNDYRFGDTYTGHSQLISPTHFENKSLITIWEYDHVIATQILSFTYSETGSPDLADIKYVLYNNDSISHQAGVRIYIDTMLGSNDCAPFEIPGVGPVTTEMDFVGDFVPDYWLCMDSIENPYVVSKGILRGEGVTIPDRFVTANYGHISGSGNEWNFTVNEGIATGDSAIGIWWNATNIAPAASRTVNTNYGIGNVETYLQQGPIAALIQAPYVVSVDPDSPYPELTVRAFLKNAGYTTARHVAAAIELPIGMQLKLGDSAVKVLGNMDPNEELQTTWNLRVTGKQIGWINYTINVTGLGIENTVVNRHVFIPRELILFGTPIYETNISVASIAEFGMQDIIKLVEGLNSTGKHYILASLLTPLGQIVAQNYTEFFIANASVGVEFSTDKDLYLPNEAIHVSSQLVNFASDSRTVNLTARSESNNTEIYSEQFIIAGHGSSQFNFTTSATATFVLAIELDVIGEEPFIITSLVKIENPSLDVTLQAPSLIGREPFELVTILTNTGHIAIDIEFALQDSELTLYDEGSYHLLPGESKIIHSTVQIINDTTLQAVITGDVETIEELYIVQSEKATITFPTFNLYQLGNVTVPLTFVNTGLAALEFNATVNVYSKANYESNARTTGGARALTALYTTLLAVYLPQNEAVTRELTITVSEGEFVLTVDSTYFSSEFEFEVIDGIAKIAFSSSEYQYYYYDMIFKVNITNIDEHDIVGELIVSTAFYTDTINFELQPQETMSDTSYIVLPEIAGGIYEVLIELRQNGQVVQQETFYIEIPSASFNVTLSDLKNEYVLNETMTPTFYVQNTGLAAGEAALRVVLPGIHDETKIAWIEPGSYEYFTFEIILPEDLIEGTYEFNYELAGVWYNTTYNVRGMKLDVEAHLDKTLYAANDTAVLTITVSKNRSVNYSLYARVQFDSYEEIQYFNLAETINQTSLTFNIPVAFTGERIFYSVYTSTGRAVYINSISIHSTNRAIVGVDVYTDKDRYYIGENVTIYINATKSGHLSLTLFNEHYETDITVSESALELTHTVTVPTLPSGTYYISYTYSGNNFSYNLTYGLEVDGVRAIVLESNATALRLDNETITIELTLNMMFNTNITGYIDLEIYDPEDFLIAQLRYPPYESSTMGGAGDAETFQFTKGVNRVSISMECSSSYSGTYRVTYQLVVNNETGAALNLTRASERFDITGAVIVSASTNKDTYQQGEQIQIEVATYNALGSTISIELDGSLVATANVTNDDHTTRTFMLPGQDEKGTHTITIRLSLCDTITSLKELEFFVSAMNHAPILSAAGVSPTSGNINTVFNFTVTYTDADNDLPYYVALILIPMDEPLAVIRLNMRELSPADLNTTDGKVYYVTYRFAQTGNYTYAFECIDGIDKFELNQYNADLTSQFLTIAVVDLPPANVSILVESTIVNVNDLITFTTDAYDPEGLSLTYHWDFGDNVTVTGQTVTHRYSAVGTYTVTLTVSDPMGHEVSATKQIEVTEAAAVSGPPEWESLYTILIVVVFIVIIAVVLVALLVVKKRKRTPGSKSE